MKWQNRNRISFLRQKSNLDQMVRHTFIEDDHAVIPCHAEKVSDIISPYSISGYETLNAEFQAYMLDNIRFIPEEYPIVLEISGGSFDEQQQNNIEMTIKTDMLYSLGEAEAEEKEAFRNFLLMIAGCLGMGFFVTVVKFVLAIANEFSYIIFWFFADTMVRYLLHDRSVLRRQRLLAGRLASMSIRFRQDKKD